MRPTTQSIANALRILSEQDPADHNLKWLRESFDQLAKAFEEAHRTIDDIRKVAASTSPEEAIAEIQIAIKHYKKGKDL